MFSALLPEPGATQESVPAPMALLLAEAHAGAGKALQALDRPAEALQQFAAATTYAPKISLPNPRERATPAPLPAPRSGITADACLNLARQALTRKDYEAAAQSLERAVELNIPTNRLREAAEIQQQITRGRRVVW